LRLKAGQKKVASEIPNAISKQFPMVSHSVNFANAAILTKMILEYITT